MSDDIILQTQFGSSRNDDSTVVSVSFVTSVPSLATKKNKYFFQYVLVAGVTNVYADTKEGDISRTILVGSLSSSVAAARLFIDDFEPNRLPWDYLEFSSRSEYDPFLAEGIACDGLFAGTDDIKSPEQHD
ncbi:unnamed protein product [Rotaria sp. Silwood2]|nr:unnamed protein product [Rotaria sp. Silwood2]CAF2750112.1 unnamed protein product [Rotaria sp. Silwood2]CAF3301467.1 unnamed protein product [Rotaria sp. Silwood2]CAF4045052.1 unnamed protein product [Rotaria sp. Silwood2]CAF4337590.1 unnamed protein product [Rotaria sp. Silwood2]